MIEQVSGYTLTLFGLFFIVAGFFMLINPEYVRGTISKAGSTPFINYAELLLRMIPAAAFILFADQSQSPALFRVIGWFMIFSSLFLIIIPRKWHHGFAVRCAEMIKPFHLQLIAQISALIGIALIISVN